MKVTLPTMLSIPHPGGDKNFLAGGPQEIDESYRPLLEALRPPVIFHSDPAPAPVPSPAPAVASAPLAAPPVLPPTVSTPSPEVSHP